MTSPREKAVSILGHQKCDAVINPVVSSNHLGCDCYSDQLHVLIAAERGRLFRRHLRSNDGNIWCVRGCTVVGDTVCAEPLTPALAWELLMVCCQAWRMRPALVLDVLTQIGSPLWMDLDEEAVGRLFLALAEAKLLRRDDAE